MDLAIITLFYGSLDLAWTENLKKRLSVTMERASFGPLPHEKVMPKRGATGSETWEFSPWCVERDPHSRGAWESRVVGLRALLHQRPPLTKACVEG